MVGALQSAQGYAYKTRRALATRLRKDTRFAKLSAAEQERALKVIEWKLLETRAPIQGNVLMSRPTFEKSGRQLSEANIVAVEAELAVTLPEPYRRFLQQTNGGKPHPHGVGNIPVDVFFSIGGELSDLVFDAKMNWDGDIPRDLLAIGYGVFGEIICIGVGGNRRGRVYVYDNEFGTLTLYAENFDTFLDSFFEPDLRNVNGH